MDIQPPDNMSLDDVRERFPGAVEDLEEYEDHGVLSIQNDRLCFEHDTPTPPMFWDVDDEEWHEQDDDA